MLKKPNLQLILRLNIIGSVSVQNMAMLLIHLLYNSRVTEFSPTPNFLSRPVTESIIGGGPHT